MFNSLRKIYNITEKKTIKNEYNELIKTDMIKVTTVSTYISEITHNQYVFNEVNLTDVQYVCITKINNKIKKGMYLDDKEIKYIYPIKDKMIIYLGNSYE